MWVEPNAVFEAVASRGTGVLATLTTLSKLILARLKREADQQSSREIGAGELMAGDDPLTELEDTSPRLILGSKKGFRIESGGPIGTTDREIRIPVAIVEEGSGRRISFSVRVNLDLD